MLEKLVAVRKHNPKGHLSSLVKLESKKEEGFLPSNRVGIVDGVVEPVNLKKTSNILADVGNRSMGPR